MIWLNFLAGIRAIGVLLFDICLATKLIFFCVNFLLWISLFWMMIYVRRLLFLLLIVNLCLGVSLLIVINRISIRRRVALVGFARVDD